MKKSDAENFSHGIPNEKISIHIGKDKIPFIKKKV